MSNPRFEAIRIANSRQPRRLDQGEPQGVSELFGQYAFSHKVMANKLPRDIYKEFRRRMRNGEPLDKSIATAVAHAAKEWALEHHVTHFTHWFQPMTGSTAEKHDSFLDLSKDGEPIERFSGSSLIQSEPDASSFPSGGMRTTFEARGYTAWDASSPMFIMETENGRTLCVPSVFISYTGEALDKKAPLLRSMVAVDRAAKALHEALDMPHSHVTATLGCEQEYFLVDRAYWALRPDLAISGRTLCGAAPAKGQDLADHYFGAIKPRVQAFMIEVERELYKLGVPAKTRHNEVAPSQYELAPVFREANVGVDHNQLMMEVMRRVAPRHDFHVLLHEKPYARVNGSGKHNNWSLATAKGDNLLEPGTHPEANLRFLCTLASVLVGVQRHGGLLRASIATHGNDFRLGSHEAPPAIMSVFLGANLTPIVEAIAAGKDPGREADEHGKIALGGVLPDVDQDTTDRNRTSPLAFTGNKFELRAVGSQQNPAWPMTILNTAVADAMSEIAEKIRKGGGGKDAVYAALKDAFAESKAVRFEGDNYSEAWVAEAEKRGLPHHRKTPDALLELRNEANVELFKRQKVLTGAEVESRYNIMVESYISRVHIETAALTSIVDEMVLPVALAERAEAAHNLAKLLELEGKGVTVDSGADRKRFEVLSVRVADLQARRVDLDAALAEVAEGDDDARRHANRVHPAVDALREAVDALETIVTDEKWPLPKYRELLFLV